MRKVHISVEGQTEETFVRDVLQPHLPLLYLNPVLLKTKRVASGPDFRGGYVPFAVMEQELRKLLGDSSAAVVTTMYDYYALPKDFPGKDKELPLDPLGRVQQLETALAKRIDNHRFRPYLQLHEYEAFLFVDTRLTCRVIGGSEEQLGQLESIKRRFASPEHIDDGVTTAPSKRVQAVLAGYDKVLHGPQVASRVGISRLAESCPHFGEWLAWLRGLNP